MAAGKNPICPVVIDLLLEMIRSLVFKCLAKTSRGSTKLFYNQEMVPRIRKTSRTTVSGKINLLNFLLRFFKRCEEYFLCKYQPPDGIHSVGHHIELEVNIYLQRFPPQQRHIRRLVFDYLLKRECCITGNKWQLVALSNAPTQWFP